MFSLDGGLLSFGMGFFEAGFLCAFAIFGWFVGVDRSSGMGTFFGAGAFFLGSFLWLPPFVARGRPALAVFP